MTCSFKNREDYPSDLFSAATATATAAAEAVENSDAAHFDTRSMEKEHSSIEKHFLSKKKSVCFLMQ